MQIPIQTYMGGGSMVSVNTLPNILPHAIVNNWSILGIPSYWRAMNYISNNMASFPRSVTKGDVDTHHPITSLLTLKPNSYQTSYNFWRNLFFHRSHLSNGYSEIIRDSQYRPVELHGHQSELVLPFRWYDEDDNLSTWYWVGGRKPHIVAFADMIHLQGLSYDGLSGMNQISLLTETYERARHVDRFISRYLVKGTVLRGSIEIPAGATPEKQEQIVNTISKYFRGADADRDLVVLSDGAKLTNNSLNNEQSQTIQLSSLTTKQVSQCTGVSPVILFDLSEGKYNNSTEQELQAVVRDLFRPMIVADEDELTCKLLSPSDIAQGYRVHLDPNALVRGDTATESNVTISQKAAGILTPNEARNVLGYPPSTDEGANKLNTLGGTSNPAPAGDTSAPAVDRREDAPPITDDGKQSRVTRPGIGSFAALFADAAARVSSKTSKALESASKRHGEDSTGLTRWGNVFANEQASFAASAIRPALATMFALGHQLDPDAVASAIGEKYAAGVRSQVGGHDEPDLVAIATAEINKYTKTNEGGQK